jgi:shikimate kinase/3-dehydroquinate synthase
MNRLHGKNIYLMGFMASGKTRIGTELAQLFGWTFCDTDDMIEQKAGKSISRIFAEDGEAAFRTIESKVVESVSRTPHCIVALGGGAVIDDKNWHRIEKTGITICLTASEETLFRRISRKSHRPLMLHKTPEQVKKRIHTMLAERLPYYLRAQYIFENDDDVPVREQAQRICEKLLENT